MIFLLEESVDGIHLNIYAISVKEVLGRVDNTVDRVNSLVIRKESINSLIMSVDDWDPSFSEVIEVIISESRTECSSELFTIHLSEPFEVEARVPLIIVFLVLA